MHPALEIRWSGPGRKPKPSPMDAFLLTMMYSRNYSSFTELGRAFKITKVAAQNIVDRVLDAIQRPLMETYVLESRKPEQVAAGIIFFNSRYPTGGFPEVALILDCSFQPSTRRGGNFDERKLYFSGKHFQYGLKREFGHLPNGKFISTNI